MQTQNSPAGGSGKLIPRLGIVLSEGAPLQIVDTKSAAARAVGLQRGDVVLAIGNLPIHSLSQLEDIIRQVPQGRNVALLVRRGQSASYVAIRLDEK
jgi:serine protease Do